MSGVGDTYRLGDDLFEAAAEDLHAPPDDGLGQAVAAAAAGTPDREVPFEANEADAAEQAATAGPADQPELPRLRFEADEADAFEQAQIVELDDEDER
jgi:hypothetical protein